MRQLAVGLSLMFFQQVTGQPSVLYYATKMFEKAGLRMGRQATGIAGVLGAFKLAMTCEHALPSHCPSMPRCTVPAARMPKCCTSAFSPSNMFSWCMCVTHPARSWVLS